MFRRYRIVLAALVAALLIASACSSVLAAGKAPRNIILIGWDGCQRDHLKEMISLNLVPNLINLSSQGNLVAIDITRITDTKAGWAEILTGYHPEITGVYSNRDFQPIPEWLTVFERLESFFGSDNIYTAFIAGKGNHVGGNLGQPYYLSKNNMDHYENNLDVADNVGNRALELLDAHGTERFFFFIHFMEPDRPGHQNGENSPEYTAAIAYDDVWLGRIIDKLEELGVRDETLVYVTADHGFDEGRSSHKDAPYVFLATDDRMVKRRGLREDITPTILWRFGVDVSALLPVLDGTPLQKRDTAPPFQGAHTSRKQA